MARYNAINAQAAVRNAGVSLGSAANNMLAFQQAAQFRRKAVLGTKPVAVGLATIASNPAPVPPIGVAVVVCAAAGAHVAYGALAYFNAQPTGIPALSRTGEAMAASLAQQYGADQVGRQNGQATVMPKAATALGCPAPGGDIIPGSPIVALGFTYDSPFLPDPHKTDKVTFVRDITIPVRCR